MLDDIVIDMSVGIMMICYDLHVMKHFCFYMVDMLCSVIIDAVISIYGFDISCISQ